VPVSKLRAALIVAAGALPLALGGYALGRQQGEGGYRILRGVLELVATQAVDSLDTDSIYTAAARGLVGRLNDPYATLFSPQDYANFSRNGLGNRYGGIGLRIVKIRGAIQVWRVIAGGPAETAGVGQGDHILQVGDSATASWSTSQVADQLTGPPGTVVHVVFARRGSGEHYERNLVRAVISVPAVPFTMLLPGSVGYLPVVSFSDHTAGDVAAALSRLQADGATRFLLDLRDNPGGSLEQSVEMAGLFLGAGRLVVRVRSRHSDDSIRADGPARLGADVPLVVLVDSGTASASEIVAGALQDYDRALIVGTNTFGKGVVQGAYNLPDGWVLKLTTGRWYTPAGRPLQRTRADSARATRPVVHSFGGREILGGGGVVPDVVVYDDTLPVAAQRLQRLLNTRATVVNDVLDSIAGDAAAAPQPDFARTGEWRTVLLRRLRAAGVQVSDTLGLGAAEFLDRLLDDRVTAFALSDSALFASRAPRDTQLKRALSLLRSRETQQELLAAQPKPTGG
jgi:carboxyl-terminal processing protease